MYPIHQWYWHPNLMNQKHCRCVPSLIMVAVHSFPRRIICNYSMRLTSSESEERFFKLCFDFLIFKLRLIRGHTDNKQLTQYVFLPLFPFDYSLDIADQSLGYTEKIWDLEQPTDYVCSKPLLFQINPLFKTRSNTSFFPECLGCIPCRALTAVTWFTR